MHEKVGMFNSLGFQGKTMERKVADAALKRAVLGREEAEETMFRFRDENSTLSRTVFELKTREKKVSERLDTVMVRLLEVHVAEDTDFTDRRIMPGRRRHMSIHRPFGRRRYGELGRRTSSRNQWL